MTYAATGEAIGPDRGTADAARPSPVASRSRLAFRQVGGKTVLAAALATSPVRLLTPRNHGSGAWVFLASLGGGLVDGDRIDVAIDAGAGTCALVTTQASTKVYRSPNGCAQRMTASVGDGAVLAIAPDPVVCFAGARYEQRVDVALEDGASAFVLDGYTCGRAARGERWEFDRYVSRSTVLRGGRPLAIDATRLDRADGSIGARMGRFEAVFTLIVVGPRLAIVRDAILSAESAGSPPSAVAAASPLGPDGAILRVAGERFADAARTLRASFAALASVLGDDVLARKW